VGVFVGLERLNRDDFDRGQLEPPLNLWAISDADRLKLAFVAP